MWNAIALNFFLEMENSSLSSFDRLVLPYCIILNSDYNIVLLSKLMQYDEHIKDYI